MHVIVSLTVLIIQFIAELDDLLMCCFYAWFRRQQFISQCGLQSTPCQLSVLFSSGSSIGMSALCAIFKVMHFRSKYFTILALRYDASSYL